MRIPSQFNEDNLYRRSARRGDSAQSYHRLIRLVIGLVLVVVVMRLASRPAIYRTFFGPQGSNAAGSGNRATVSAVTAPRLRDADAAPVDPNDRRVAQYLTQQLPTDQQRYWVAALSRWETGAPIGEPEAPGDRLQPIIAATAPALLQQLSSMQDVSEQSRRSP